MQEVKPLLSFVLGGTTNYEDEGYRIQRGQGIDYEDV